MEVASPLPFPGQAGTKRPFACSPGHSPIHGMDATTDDFEYGQQTFKRRRFNSNENMDAASSSQPPSHPFLAATTSMARAPFNSSTVASLKRTRPDSTEGNDEVNDLKRVVDTQAAEIESLKGEKASLERSLGDVQAAHDKAVNENKILKKAVTIQQERQNQAASEIEGARRFKVDAEDKIKRLEQMVLTLQYHFQAQNANSAGHDFMGFPPRPPDVY